MAGKGSRNGVTIGADPEFFVSRNEKLIPAPYVTSGTKARRKKLTPHTYAFADNAAVEINVTPQKTQAGFCKIIKEAIDNVEMQMNCKASPEVTMKVTAEQVLEMPLLREFGCDPDFNAWTYSMNQFTVDPSSAYLRSAGGHIHVGNLQGVPVIPLIRAMDLYLGVPSLILDKGEGSALRRNLYGKAGAYRPQPWGCEYRVLSSFWIHSEDLVKWVFKATNLAIVYVKEHGIIEDDSPLAKDIQNCINTGDVEMAEFIMTSIPSVRPKL